MGAPVIAGDGYAYFPYEYTLQPLAANQKICNSDGGETETSHWETHSRLLRVGSDGSATEIAIGDWSKDSVTICLPPDGTHHNGGECGGQEFSASSGSLGARWDR